MASTTSLFFKPSNNNQKTTTTTTPKPDPNPKPRSRKGGRGQKGPTKAPQRGMGVAKLEIQRIELEKQSGDDNSSTNNNHKILASQILAKSNTTTSSYVVAPLAGVPVHPYPVTLAQFYFPGQVGSSPIRALPMGLDPVVQNHFIPEPTHDPISYKKKRVNGEEENEGIGFGNKGKEKQQIVDYDQSLQFSNHNNFNYYNNGNYYGGFHVNNNGDHNNYHQFSASNGILPPYYDFTATDREVMAIHQNWNKSNMMMEYGFFPRKPEANEDENNNKNCYLDLKLGSYSSYTSSPSSSSLTTIINFNPLDVSDTSLDLSLRL